MLHFDLDSKVTPRTFKTQWFAKEASKARISDAELCEAIKQVRLGQCDDLGGGVFKKRLSKNLYRSIIVTKALDYWVYAFLFAKNDRQSINSRELEEFRKLARLYATKTETEIAIELKLNVLVEICNEEKYNKKDFQK